MSVHACLRIFFEGGRRGIVGSDLKAHSTPQYHQIAPEIKI